MAFQKKKIWMDILRAVLLCPLFMLVICAGVCYLRPENFSGEMHLFVVGIIMVLFSVFVVAATIAEIFRSVRLYRYAKETDVLGSLAGIRDYATDEEMRKAFESQRSKCLYSDYQLIVTENFVADAYANTLFLMNGILDATCTVHETNGTIDKVVLSIVYLDGELYKTTYRRSEDSGSMRDRADIIPHVVNLIAKRSVNFRKHLPPAKKKS